MPDLSPEDSREPGQQERDVVRGALCEVCVVQLELGCWRRARGSKQASGETVFNVPSPAGITVVHRDRQSLRRRGGHADRVSLVGQLRRGAQNWPLA